MKFTYEGVEDAADPKGTEAFGLYFPVGKPIEVSDPRAAAKLAGHQHFKAADPEAKKEEKAAEEAAAIPPSLAPTDPEYAERRGPGRPRKVD